MQAGEEHWCSIKNSRGSSDNRELSRITKILVYKAMIEPTLTYGAESWVLRERNKEVRRLKCEIQF